MLLLLGCLTSATEYGELQAQARDADGDGFPALAWGGSDCDDGSDTIYPGAPELCDGLDNDCDGLLDADDVLADGEGVLLFLDEDSDGFGTSDTASVLFCSAVSGYASADGDCDDSSAAVNPAAAEVCNDGVDNDCSGDAPECGFEGEVDLRLADSTINHPRGTDIYSALGVIDSLGQSSLILGRGGLNSDGGIFLFPLPLRTTEDSMATILVEHADDPQFGGALAVFASELEYSVAVGGEDTVYLLPSGSGLPNPVQATLVQGPGIGKLVRSTPGGGLLLSGGDTDPEVYFFESAPLQHQSADEADFVFRGDSSLADIGGVGTISLGDLDSDGVQEVVFGVPRTHEVYVHEIAQSLALVRYPTFSLNVVGEPQSYFGTVVDVGDVDGDGSADLVVADPGEPTASDTSRAIYVFSGGPDFLSADFESSDYLSKLECRDCSFGFAVSFAIGDFNGQGGLDLATSDFAGSSYVFSDIGPGLLEQTDADVSFFTSEVDDCDSVGIVQFLDIGEGRDSLFFDCNRSDSILVLHPELE